MVNENFQLKVTLPLKDDWWIRPPRAFTLNMKSLSVGIVAIRVPLSAAAMQYRANDGVRYSPRFIVPNQERVSCSHATRCWWCETCANYISKHKHPRYIPLQLIPVLYMALSTFILMDIARWISVSGSPKFPRLSSFTKRKYRKSSRNFLQVIWKTIELSRTLNWLSFHGNICVITSTLPVYSVH